MLGVEGSDLVPIAIAGKGRRRGVVCSPDPFSSVRRAPTVLMKTMLIESAERRAETGAPGGSYMYREMLYAKYPSPASPMIIPAIAVPCPVTL